MYVYMLFEIFTLQSGYSSLELVDLIKLRSTVKQKFNDSVVGIGFQIVAAKKKKIIGTKITNLANQRDKQYNIKTKTNLKDDLNILYIFTLKNLFDGLYLNALSDWSKRITFKKKKKN